MSSDAIARARTALATADRVLALTGAGVSHASGVPTFRGTDGLWRQYRAESLATPEAFASDPRLVWEWYGWRRDLVAACAPNAAHRALARFALSRPGVTLVTQNVDGLHDVAADEAVPPEEPVGGPLDQPPNSARPIALHGSLFQLRCPSCGLGHADRSPIDATRLETLPHCVCGALLRPDVVWFGEALNRGKLEAAIEAAAEADVCLVVGTSGVVYPAAGLAEIAARHGGLVIEVNAEDTPLSELAAIRLRGDAAVLVPALLD